ncbi:MAG: SusC/RagA family TonB-linked outer membrane protein [Gemmatimonadales bacterium]
MGTPKRTFGRLGLAVLVAALLATPAWAQTGTITGRVTGTGVGGGPLEAARLIVVGTNITTTTNRDGAFTLRAVPAGQHQVRVTRLGFTSKSSPVTVASGQTATIDFVLDPAPFTLEEITTTASGEQRKLESGNTVHTIQVNTLVETAPVKDLSQILLGRAPGVQVLPSTGTTGGSQRIRIRGSNSVSLSNEPLFVIDGVRMESGESSISVGTGGQSPSRLNDINPEDIADIQILKGPSASVIYGTGGSNGVVLITTKRGVAGRTQWNFWGEAGVLHDKNDYPDNYYGAAADGSRCRLDDQARGLCTVASITSFNPLRDPTESPIHSGFRQQYGGAVSGGTEQVRYYVTGEWEGERGVLFMPDAEQTRVLSETGRSALRAEELNPNTLGKWSLRANTDFNVSSKARAGVRVGFVTSDLWLPQNDNNVTGLHSSGINGDGRGPDAPGGAWGFFTPGDVFGRLTRQKVRRLTTSADAQFTPTTWLTARTTLGWDQTERQDQQFQRFGEGPNFSTYRLGYADENRRTIDVYTVDASATATFAVTDAIQSKTTGGLQYSENSFRGTDAHGEQLPPGSVTVSSGAIKDAAETNTFSKTAGAFVEQQFAFNDRFFVNGAVRVDRNSSAGFESRTIIYPKASVSYLVPGFEAGTISSLRLRGSFGQAGQQPGGTTALEIFDPLVTAVGAGITDAGVVINNLGDPTLKPERSTEFEAGFDATLFDNRVSVELTGYHKETRDALIFVPTPVSAGNPNGQFRNIGKTRNQGLEAVISAQVLNTESLNWDFTFTGSLLRNRLLDLGGQPPINANGTTQQHREGLPLGGYWARPYTYSDANGDGIIGRDELVMGDSLEYIAPSQATREAAITMSFGLFQNRVSVSTTLDYRGGFRLYNLQEDFRCRSSQNCAALYDKNAPLADQARIEALRFQGSNNTNTGFIEKGDYAKWRELSVTFNAPQSLANALGAARASLSFAGRNLALFTSYSGPDPEVNGQGEANFAQRDFLSLPPIRTMILRLNLSY